MPGMSCVFPQMYIHRAQFTCYLVLLFTDSERTPFPTLSRDQAIRKGGDRGSGRVLIVGAGIEWPALGCGKEMKKKTRRFHLFLCSSSGGTWKALCVRLELAAWSCPEL